MAEHTWSPVLLFDSDDQEFARGVEVGKLYEAVRTWPRTEPYEATVHGSNAEMVLRIAEATRRPVKADHIDETWMSVTYGEGGE